MLVYDIWLPGQAEPPMACCLDEEVGLRTFLIGIAQNDDFQDGFEFSITVDDNTSPFYDAYSPSSFSRYKKNGKKIVSLFETKLLSGLLQRLGLEEL